MNEHPEGLDPIDQIHRDHPGWRISYDAGIWYARGPWLQANTLQATTPADLDRQLTQHQPAARNQPKGDGDE